MLHIILYFLIRFLEALEHAGFADVEKAALHVLLFVSALIPKALSSLLTSLIIETNGKSKVSHYELSCITWVVLQIIYFVFLYFIKTFHRIKIWMEMQHSKYENTYMNVTETIQCSIRFEIQTTCVLVLALC